MTIRQARKAENVSGPKKKMKTPQVALHIHPQPQHLLADSDAVPHVSRCNQEREGSPISILNTRAMSPSDPEQQKPTTNDPEALARPQQLTNPDEDNNEHQLKRRIRFRITTNVN